MTITPAIRPRQLLAAVATTGALALAPVADSMAADHTHAITAPIVPAALSVPAGHHVASRYDAVGFQVYECSAAGAWTLRAPLAQLRNRDTLDVGKHFGGVDVGLPAGPYWQSRRDGSRVHAGGAVSAPAPQPATIPWLRLTALDTSGSGVFSDVAYIHRVDTTGGIAPAGPCNPDRSTLRHVPYTATYFFYERD